MLPVTYMVTVMVGGGVIIGAALFVAALMVQRFRYNRSQFMAVIDPPTQLAQLVRRKPAPEHDLKVYGVEKKVHLQEGLRHPGVGAGLWIVEAKTGHQVRIPPLRLRGEDGSWPKGAWSDAKMYFDLCNESIDELVNSFDAKWAALEKAMPWLVLMTLMVVSVILGVVVYYYRQGGA